MKVKSYLKDYKLNDNDFQETSQLVINIEYVEDSTPVDTPIQHISFAVDKEKLIELSRDLNQYDEEYPSQKLILDKLDLLLSRNQQ